MEDVKRKVAEFLSSGDDDGYGYGEGEGYGSGYGSGRGSDDGYGDGYGDGDGDGYGDGYGSGLGYHNGSGHGRGSGEGLKFYCGAEVHLVDGMATIIYSVRGNIARGAIVRGDLILHPCYIAKVDGYFAHGTAARDAYKAAEEKALSNESTEQRIERFAAKYPDPDVKIAAKELCEWHHILTGSCEMGRREFARAHNIDIDTASLTANEFINLTKSAYGGENIALLGRRYDNH